MPSYYPITAYEAQSGQVLRVQNRPGDIHDGKAGARRFCARCFTSCGRRSARGYALEFRMDGAFFRRDVLELLERAGAEYAIKVPFYPWVGLQGSGSRQTRTWTRVDGDGELRRARGRGRAPGGGASAS